MNAAIEQLRNSALEQHEMTPREIVQELDKHIVGQV